ncbi:uncharacterized protein LOC132453039 [Gadus macrocephalus]|uniref:uncharacterized protein LOC132453039 n=1 Tax=Gadus macrocephalus TaxID=80720 RepID=UPI0028CB225E|nr:uncharacterized protein LOC132453039 [Gadus macrocephalus]
MIIMPIVMAARPTDVEGRDSYTPWGHRRDMVGLAARLPRLTDGAAAWIREFEKESSGVVLGLGDVRAMLDRAQAFELEKLTRTAELPDRTFFNPYRNLFWERLRELFPAVTVGISGVSIKPGESISEYIDRARGLWAECNDCYAHSWPAVEIFKIQLLQGLPAEVRKALETVVALSAKPWEEWKEHLVHHYCLDLERRVAMDDELKELKRQLMRLQIKKLEEKSLLREKAEDTQEPPTLFPSFLALPPAYPGISPPGWLPPGYQDTDIPEYMMAALQLQDQGQGGRAGRGRRGPRPK